MRVGCLSVAIVVFACLPWHRFSIFRLFFRFCFRVDKDRRAVGTRLLMALLSEGMSAYDGHVDMHIPPVSELLSAFYIVFHVLFRFLIQWYLLFGYCALPYRYVSTSNELLLLYIAVALLFQVLHFADVLSLFRRRPEGAFEINCRWNRFENLNMYLIRSQSCSNTAGMGAQNGVVVVKIPKIEVSGVH